MNLFRRLCCGPSWKSRSAGRSTPRLSAQLALETLEPRLVPTGPPIGIIRPPIGGILLAEYVVPESQPVDSSHFHSINAAVLGAFANPFRQGTNVNVVISIEPGASPDPGTVNLTQSSSTVKLTIQGDPNVPATILPSEVIQLTGTNYALVNLNLASLTLGAGAGDTATGNNLVSKCQITTVVENGIHSNFTQNTITSSAEFNGRQQYQDAAPDQSNDDRVTNNTFIGVYTPILGVYHCDGTIIRDNHFYCSNNAAIEMQNCGELGLNYCIVSQNTITTTGSPGTGIEILQLDDLGNGFAAVYVNNNTINTNGGTGLYLSCQDGDQQHFDVYVQGNDFRNNAIGVSITGGGSSSGCGIVDLGGNSNDVLGASLGGNDFRGFTALGTASAAAIVLLNTSAQTVVSAASNIFSPGVSPPSVVDDGVEGSLTGTGQINVVPALDNAHAYVQGLYNNVLGRTGTTAELNAWINVLNTQGQAAVANGILRSGESLGRIVDSLYLRFLSRNADATGRAAWINRLQHGATLEQIEQGFLTSPEYLSHIDTEYVQSLYINLLGRTASAGELAAWDSQVQALGLAGIANGFLTSQEYRADNVIADYTGFLHRQPSPTEISNFVNSPTDLLSIEGELLNTQECFNNI